MAELIDRKKAYQEKTAAQLEQLKADFNKIRAQAKEKSADGKIEIADFLDGLEDNFIKTKRWLGGIAEMSEEGWQDTKSTINQSIARIKDKIEDAKKNLA